MSPDRVSPALDLPFASSAWFEPDHLSWPAPWAGHIPFAAWLMACARPRSLVELGVYSGISYLTFCQAAVEHGVGLQAWGVDTWEGDPHAGYYGESIFSELQGRHDERYGGFSTLLRKTFDQALQGIPDASIDLLHIDGLHTYEAVRHDFETWQGKLSERAIVLFHDIEVRRGDFGVWRFWSEITERFPSLSFEHSHGLGVLLVGPQAPQLLKDLAADPQRWQSVRSYFRALGERFELRAERMRLDTALSDLKEKSRAAAADRDADVAQLKAAREEVQALRASNEKLSREGSAAARKLKAVKARCRALDARIQDLLSSRSWRMTAGVRKLGAAARTIMAYRAGRTTPSKRRRAKTASRSATREDRAAFTRHDRRVPAVTIPEAKKSMDHEPKTSRKKIDRLRERIKHQSQDIEILENRVRVLVQGRAEIANAKTGPSKPAPSSTRGGLSLSGLKDLLVPKRLKSKPAGVAQTPPIPSRAVIPRQYQGAIFRSPALSGDTPTEYLERYVAPAQHHADFATLDQFLAVAYLNSDRLLPPLSQADLRVIAYMDDYKTRCASAYADRPQDECVSIIMPTHDRADVIADAILSVEMQSYQNWELIVVDDGSPTDAGAAVVAQFEDPRIRYLRLDARSGNGAARNAGLRLARGSVIAYLDDDDQWDPDHLLVTLNQMRDAGRNCAYGAQIVWSGFNQRAGIGQEFKAVRFAPFNRSLLENTNYISMISFVHDADLLQRTGTFDESLGRYLDWDLFLRMTEVNTPLAIPAITSHYYQRRTTTHVSAASGRQAAIAAIRERVVARSGWTIDIGTGAGTSYQGYANPARSREMRRTTRESMPARPVEILIPNYECADELEACIASIEQCTEGAYHVTIVDNGSSPATIERLSDFCARKQFVSFVVDDGPSGFSHAVNRGLAEIGWAATSDILLLNNDTIVTPGWLEEMQYVLWRHPDVGMAVPRQVLLPGTRIIRPHVPGALDTHECDTNVSQHHRNLLDRTFDPAEGFIELNFAPLFAGLIRGGVFQQLSGLNARNGPHYRSDWIFCDALRRILQLRIVYTPHSKIYHLQGVASREQAAVKTQVVPGPGAAG